MRGDGLFFSRPATMQRAHQIRVVWGTTIFKPLWSKAAAYHKTASSTNFIGPGNSLQSTDTTTIGPWSKYPPRTFSRLREETHSATHLNSMPFSEAMVPIGVVVPLLLHEALVGGGIRTFTPGFPSLGHSREWLGASLTKRRFRLFLLSQRSCAICILPHLGITLFLFV